MPNWVMTKVTITGPENQIVKLRQIIDRYKNDPKTGFFDQIAPKPEGLDDIANTHGVDLLNRAFSEYDLYAKLGKLTYEIVKDGNEEKSREIFLLLLNLVKAADFKKTIGFSSWYHWNWGNWGTKWDVFYDYFFILSNTPTEIKLSFQTAWNLADGALISLYHLLDEKCQICGEYADEDIGHNCGFFSIRDGNCFTTKPEDPVQFALDLWGRSREEYEQEENNGN